MSSDRKLLVLLIDGFRWDYFDLPGLELSGFPRLFRQGVKAEYLIPDFPTLSYPNYYSLMTGLHAEDHGFVGNFMYNKKLKHSFNVNMDTEESNYSHWFEGAEPLWVAAEKQAKRSYFLEWPGAHVPNKGIAPSMCDTRDTVEFPTLQDMVSNLQKAFDMFKAGKIDLAGVYLYSVDETGHMHGPNSKQMVEIIQKTDTAIDQMLDMLSDSDLQDKVNIVIFSDHGMTELSADNIIDFSSVYNSEDIEMAKDKGPVCNIWPKEGMLDKVYRSLNCIDNEHVAVFKKEDIPERLHYSNHNIISPIVAVADLGWYITIPGDPGISQYDGEAAKGYHGYDNKEPDMRGIFLAIGPEFRRGYKNGPVRAVDVYQVMCKALDIKPGQHRGQWDNVKDMFLL